MTDKYGFLENVTNWCNHRPLLLLALELTPGKRVIELGCGDGSTPYLQKYCEYNRDFISFESDREWAKKHSSYNVDDWDADFIYKDCGVAFLDHAPGEHRHIAAKRFKDKADIIVLHDSEEGGAGNYMYDKIWPLFNYRLNYNRRGGGAGASMVSNKIDLSIYKGTKIGEFEIE